MNIYLVRHGETYWNRENKIQTYSNGPENRLTDKGIEDAASNARILISEPIEIIYHSALERSIQTANIIGEITGCKNFIQDERINDGCLGFLDGMTASEFKSKFPELYEKRKKDKFNYRLPNLFQKEGIPNQESLYDLYIRAMPVAKKILEEQKDALIVGHKSANKALLLHFLENSKFCFHRQDISKFEIPNIGVYKVTYDHKRRKAISIEYNLGNRWVLGHIHRTNE